MNQPESEEKLDTCDDPAVADAVLDPPPGDDPASASPAADGDLRQQLAAAQREAREHYDRFVRERAELENFKKRMQRERSEALRFAMEPLIRDLLPVVDNLERALAHVPPGAEGLADGVRYVLTALLDTLARFGVTRVEATGAKFDPAVHQAMARVESDDYPPNTVVEQHVSGFRLHDRLLRPAMVSVSAQKSESAVETPPDSD